MTGEHDVSELPRMTDLGITADERNLLLLVRLQCASYERNQMQGMDEAYTLAEEQFGPDVGPLVAARITALIRAVRAEWSARFSYLSPRCASCRERITSSEWHLLRLMRAATHASTDVVAANAKALNRNDEAPRVAAAVLRFVDAIKPSGPVEPEASGRTLH